MVQYRTLRSRRVGAYEVALADERAAHEVVVAHHGPARRATDVRPRHRRENVQDDEGIDALSTPLPMLCERMDTTADLEHAAHLPLHLPLPLSQRRPLFSLPALLHCWCVHQSLIVCTFSAAFCPRPRAATLSSRVQLEYLWQCCQHICNMTVISGTAVSMW